MLLQLRSIDVASIYIFFFWEKVTCIFEQTVETVQTFDLHLLSEQRK